VHSLLKRQLKKYLSDGFVVPEEMKEFVDSVNRAYKQFDEDREMLERSLELSSRELMQANSEMRATLQAFPDLVFSDDRNGIIANALKDVLGQAFLGKTIIDVVENLTLIGRSGEKHIVNVSVAPIMGRNEKRYRAMLPLRLSRKPNRPADRLTWSLWI